jgi:hypothetical protein
MPRDTRISVPLSRVLRRSLRAAIASIAMALSSPASADTPVPTCKGHNPAAAASARAEGLRHYRASKREGPGDAEMATALGFFEAACAAGDDTALELRAYALAGVERFVEAAQTLDVFLATHPVDTLPPATQARVAQQQPEILARIASLAVQTPDPGARVNVNHQPAGVTPIRHLRLLPGRYDVEVIIEGAAPVTRALDLAAGEHTETFGPASAAAEVKAATAQNASPEPPRKTLRPWVIGTASGAAVMLAGGIAGVIWANDRSNTYNDAKCAGTAKAGCPGTLSQYYDARDIEIVGFVGAGLATLAAGVLFYLDSRSAPAPRASAIGWSCSLPGAAISCGAIF